MMGDNIPMELLNEALTQNRALTHTHEAYFLYFVFCQPKSWTGQQCRQYICVEVNYCWLVARPDPVVVIVIVLFNSENEMRYMLGGQATGLL